jgi:DNA-binding response OmpR family regulator
MFKHNIIITEFDILYQILFEINDYLKFNLKKSSLKNIDRFDLNGALILSNFAFKDQLEKKKIDPNKIILFSKNSELTKNINDYNYINIPFNIDDFAEKINVLLLKKKFNSQSFIKISDYTLDLNSRIISNELNNLKLTEKEINVIVFLSKNKKPQKVNVLQNEVWGYSSELETHTVETHIYRLRKKISDKFKDDNFIVSKNNGYFIK